MLEVHDHEGEVVVNEPGIGIPEVRGPKGTGVLHREVAREDLVDGLRFEVRVEGSSPFGAVLHVEGFGIQGPLITELVVTDERSVLGGERRATRFNLEGPIGCQFPVREDPPCRQLQGPHSWMFGGSSDRVDGKGRAVVRVELSIGVPRWMTTRR